MDISGEYTFDAPQEMVWKALLDPNVLGAVMPGGKGFEQTGENQYKGTLEVKVGPVQGTFQGVITLSQIVPPRSYHIEVDGRGAPGYVKGNGSLNLEAQDDKTHMTYSGHAQVGGRIASVGQRLMDSAARSIIHQSLDALNAYFKFELEKQQPAADAEASTTPPAARSAEPQQSSQFKPPSQMAVVRHIMQDVMNDAIPPKYQPYVLGVCIGLVLLAIWYILSR